MDPELAEPAEPDRSAAPFYHRPLVPWLLAYTAGIWAGVVWPGLSVAAVGLAGGGAGWMIRCRMRQTSTLLAALMWFGALGYLAVSHWTAPRFPDHHVSRHTDRGRVTVTGCIDDFPRETVSRTRFVLRVDTLGGPGVVRPATGKIRVTLSGEHPPLRRGDTIRFSGRLRSVRSFRNPGGFDYRRYLAFRHITATVWLKGDRVSILHKGEAGFWTAGLAPWRESISRQIGSTDTGEAGAVLAALTIGERGGITPALRGAFNRAGIGHLLAISGLHVGIVAAVSFAAMRWVLGFVPCLLWRAWTRKGAALISLAAVFGYGALAGWTPSTQRAVIMVALFMAGFLAEKPHDLVNALALAAFVILVIHPPTLYAVSFQLSFAAVSAIAFGVSVVKATSAPTAAFPQRMRDKAMAFLLVSLSAIVGTLPLVARHFNQFSLIGLLTNCIFVPLMGFVAVPAGLAAAVLLPIFPDAAAILMEADIRFLALLIAGVHFFADLPFAAVNTITPNGVEIVGYYLLLWALAQWVETRRVPPSAGRDAERENNRRRAKWVALITACVLCADGAYALHRRFFPGEVTVSVMDVGQGAAAAVMFPNGKVWLIDGGGFSDPAAFDVGAGVVAPLLSKYRIRTVDTVVLTHANADHMNGLIHILSHFQVHTVWFNGETSGTDGYRRFLSVIRQRGIDMPSFRTLARSQRIGGATVELMHPLPDFMENREAVRGKLNDNSLVIRVTYGALSFLFPGDITAGAETELVRRFGGDLKSTVLMAPHHGSRTSSTPAFVNCVDPVVVAISAGWQNPYGFPHAAVLQRYATQRSRIYRTDTHGAVIFVTDGKRLYATAWRHRDAPRDVFTAPAVPR